jgi:hypothetical protein
MKKKFNYSTSVSCIVVFGVNTSYVQANQLLSELTSPTAVNVHLLPDKNNKTQLGNTAKSWQSLYLDTAAYIGGIAFQADLLGPASKIQQWV